MLCSRFIVEVVQNFYIVEMDGSKCLTLLTFPRYTNNKMISFTFQNYNTTMKRSNLQGNEFLTHLSHKTHRSQNYLNVYSKIYVYRKSSWKIYKSVWQHSIIIVENKQTKAWKSVQHSQFMSLAQSLRNKFCIIFCCSIRSYSTSKIFLLSKIHKKE